MSVEAEVEGSDVAVTWGASDSGSGLFTCTLEVREGAGAWEVLSTECAGETTYDAVSGRNYTFRFSATDEAGNAASAEAQASVLCVTKYHHFGGRRVAMRQDGVVS